MAQSNDPTFAAAHYAYQAAREKIPQAKTGLLPVVNLNGSENASHASSKFTNTPLINRAVQAWTWSLQLTQPLFSIQNIFAFGESKSLVEAAHAQYAQAEQALILRVTQAYFDVLVARESIAVHSVSCVLIITQNIPHPPPALPLEGEELYSLPFKGRVGVGMGVNTVNLVIITDRIYCTFNAFALPRLL